jgi:hypothetical protein
MLMSMLVQFDMDIMVGAALRLDLVLVLNGTG